MGLDERGLERDLSPAEDGNSASFIRGPGRLPGASVARVARTSEDTALFPFSPLPFTLPLPLPDPETSDFASGVSGIGVGGAGIPMSAKGRELFGIGPAERSLSPTVPCSSDVAGSVVASTWPSLGPHIWFCGSTISRRCEEEDFFAGGAQATGALAAADAAA